jgi:hypothetical protein
LALVPALKTEIEGLRKARLDDYRQMETLQAIVMTLRRELQLAQQKMGEKAKPIILPQPVAVKPEFGGIPWSPAEQEEAQGKKHRNLHLSLVLPLLGILLGSVFFAYYITLPVPTAVSADQAALIIQEKALLSGFGVALIPLSIGLRWFWTRRRRKPSPAEVMQAPAVPQPQKVA